MNLMFNITFMLSVCEKFSIMMMVEDKMNEFWSSTVDKVFSGVWRRRRHKGNSAMALEMVMGHIFSRLETSFANKKCEL